MIKFILFTLFVSSPLFAQIAPPVESPTKMTEELSEHRKFNPRKGHWYTAFGFEGLKYEVPFNFPEGVKRKFSPGTQELWGGRIGVGTQIYIGAGLTTSTKVEGYYVGTLFSEVLNGGAQDVDVKFAFTKKTGQVYGVDASQTLGYLFDMKTKNPIMEEWTYLTVEPFVEAGIGLARAYNRLNYSYVLTPTNELYRQKVEDELMNLRIGGGVNFTSNTGYFFFLKVTQNRYDVTDRKINGIIKANTDPAETSFKSSPKNVKIDPITIYALGGGYRF